MQASNYKCVRNPAIVKTQAASVLSFSSELSCSLIFLIRVYMMAASIIELQRLIEERERVRPRLTQLKNFCIACGKFTKASSLQERLNHHIPLFDNLTSHRNHTINTINTADQRMHCGIRKNFEYMYFDTINQIRGHIQCAKIYSTFCQSFVNTFSAIAESSSSTQMRSGLSFKYSYEPKGWVFNDPSDQQLALKFTNLQWSCENSRSQGFNRRFEIRWINQFRA